VDRGELETKVREGTRRSGGQRGRNTEALVIDTGEITYADLLKQVKASVDDTRTKDAIQTVIRTQTGKLLLAVKKGEGQARLLKE
jgi:hypothetical protein